MNKYSILNISELDTPSLVVFPEIVKYNIQKAIKLIGDKNRLRPHIKTHKTAEVIKFCQEVGIDKFKCATIAEAELLAICNAKDVLLAYQPIGKKAERFIKLIQNYPKTNFSCLVDCFEIASQISILAATKQVEVNIYLDINAGMNRTGIVPNLAIELIEKLQKLSHLNILGLHCYDGNIRDTDINQRKIACDDSFDKLLELQDKSKKEYNLNLKIIAGGSPTFPIHAKREQIECSPGTFVFWDKGYQDLCPEQDFIPAVLAVTRIISFPIPTRICTDLGHKSIAAENELSKRVYFINEPSLKFIGQSEEHLILETDENHNYSIGDVLFGIPVHICPTIALYDKLHIVENEHLTEKTWNVLARNREINI